MSGYLVPTGRLIIGKADNREYIRSGAAYERYPAQSQRRRSEVMGAGYSGAATAASAASSGALGAAALGHPLVNAAARGGVESTYQRAKLHPELRSQAKIARESAHRGLKFAAKHRNKLTVGGLAVAPAAYLAHTAARMKREESLGLSGDIARMKSANIYQRKTGQVGKSLAPASLMWRIGRSKPVAQASEKALAWSKAHPKGALGIGIGTGGTAVGGSTAYAVKANRRRRAELMQARKNRGLG